MISISIEDGFMIYKIPIKETDNKSCCVCKKPLKKHLMELNSNRFFTDKVEEVMVKNLPMGSRLCGFCSSSITSSTNSRVKHITDKLELGKSFDHIKFTELDPEIIASEFLQRRLNTLIKLKDK